MGLQSHVKQVMGPPNKPPPRSKNTKKSTSTPSSGTNWGRSCHSVINTSTLKSASTTISSEIESRVIIAVTEGRGDARCEVGLASIDLSLPNLILCQISDSQSYINTLTKINILNPTDIILPSTFLETDSRLVDKIRKKFPNIKILGIPRKTFNKTAGMERILQLCLPSVNTICVGLQHKYYALAAASALTTYLQSNLNIYYAKSSLNVTYQESEGYAIIDVSTADRLELVSSTKPARATRYSTLFGVLNHCVTKVGARLLRSTILQPPSSPQIIEKTSQCVSELIKHPETLLSIQTILQKLSNIDQLLTITSMTLSTNDSCSVRQLNYLLLLNGLIDLIEPLKEVIENYQQPFFTELKQTLQSENFQQISEKIRTMIHPSAQFARNEAGVTQRCFAIKSDVNGLLDLVRKTYSERFNDLKEYVRHLGNKYNLPLTLGNNNTKGYHIVLKLSNQQKRTFKRSDLPPEFIQVYRLAGSFTMKTPELINLSTRLEDIMNEILKISNSMIYNMIVDLKQYVGFFYKLCEDLARLDMLLSLAECSRRGGYTRPKFGDFTELTNARHPMLEMLIGEQRVANPISICQDFNVQIITGPNGSGKSIYIRQVMLLQVMAQVGCYVPADSAIFRPMSRMFARVYLEDDIEYGASSFILEMKEVKYMMTLLSENSLFIIDELCRSTAADEGAALAMTICEKFCTTGVFLYVTTHYPSLTNLANKFLNVKTWQMETLAEGDTPQDLVLDFRFRLIPGVTNLKHYGVYIVKKIWPESLLNEVYCMLNNSRKVSENEEDNSANAAAKLKYKLISDLKKLKSVQKLTRASINKLLNEYQNELQRLNIYIDLNLREEAFETSSYRELSNFLQEDSDNINMLVPEVSIASSERELRLNEATNEAHSSQTWGGNIQDLTDDERQFILEELESASQSFQDDEDFDFSQVSSYKTVSSQLENENQHIFPVVNVIEGPRWSPDSSLISPPKAIEDDSTSISYSPLCSQTSIDNEKSSGQTAINKSNLPHTSTSSSLQFLSKKDTEVRKINLDNTENLKSMKNSTSSTENLKSTSSVRNTTSPTMKESDPENLKSISSVRNSASSSMKESDSGPKQKKKPKRFIPPKKLTKKEIQEEFDEQDRKMYQSDIPESELSKYLSKILNRPSVKQVQNSKHLAFVRKTEEGVEVIPAAPSPLKKKRNLFQRHLSTTSSNNIDMTIFSDKNAKCFDEFLNSDERDVKRFKLNLEQNFNIQPQTISEYAANIEKTHVFYKSQNSVASSSDVFHSLTPIMPDYYKENRSDIDNIVNKYLQEKGTSNSNIFETCSLNEKDLDF